MTTEPCARASVHELELQVQSLRKSEADARALAEKLELKLKEARLRQRERELVDRGKAWLVYCASDGTCVSGAGVRPPGSRNDDTWEETYEVLLPNGASATLLVRRAGKVDPPGAAS